MDIKKIRALSEVLTDHKLYELILEENGEKLILKHPSGKVAEIEQILSAAQITSSAVAVGAAGPSPHAVPLNQAASVSPALPIQVQQSEQVQQAPPDAGGPDNEVIVTSPMVGVFYSCPSPEQPAFAAVGQTVSEGSVLCIIEAMKLMNEITAEQSGVVLETYCENGALVEFGQKLFKLRVE